MSGERLKSYVKELNRVFRASGSKHRAHEQSRRILEDISTDRDFVAQVLQQYLATPRVLNTKNYPAVGMNVELNPDYHLVANCWIPLPGGQSDISTKAIHHHGTMLLTTTTLFGPGYEHWLFSIPTEIDPERELYAMKVTDRRSHPQHDTAFVEAFEPHLPMYPSGLTITLALWSHQEATTWKDWIKRIPWLKKNEQILRRWALSAGLAKNLALKIVSYFDFYPTLQGFKGMKERLEFGLGPNEDFLHSLFHILQRTQNDSLASLIEQHLEAGKIPFSNPGKIRELLKDLKAGRPIEGKLSECHLGVPHATFKSREIEQAAQAAQALGGP